MFCRDPILQFGPDIYHNTTEECECSHFRLLEMLYVYLMLPEQRGLSVCEDTQRLCHECTLTFETWIPCFEDPLLFFTSCHSAQCVSDRASQPFCCPRWFNLLKVTKKETQENS